MANASYQAIQHCIVAVASSLIKVAQQLEFDTSRYCYYAKEYDFLSTLAVECNKKFQHKIDKADK
jgi:hypothetical protein